MTTHKLYILRGGNLEQRAAYAKKRKLRNCFDFDKHINLQNMVEPVLKEGKKKVVVVAGHFNRFYLMAPYLQLGRKYHYKVEVLRLPNLPGDNYNGEIFVC